MSTFERSQSGGGAPATRQSSHVSARSVGSSVKESLQKTHDVLDDIATLMDAENNRHEGPTKPLATSAVVFNLANTTMGVGILTLATTFQDAGLVAGPILMVLCAICTYYSVMMLIKVINICRVPSKDEQGVPSIEEVAEYCLGWWGKCWIQLVLVMICVGTLIAYLVSVKSLFYSGLIHLISENAKHTIEDHGFTQQTSMLVILILLCLPLSLLRRLDGLWFTSFLSVVSILYFVIITLVHYANNGPEFCDELHRANGTHGVELPAGPANIAPPSFRGLLDAFNIISVSYICQLTVVPIQKELVKGQMYGDERVPYKAAKMQMSRAMLITMLIALCLYSGAGFGGYLTWRQLTSLPSTILACYNPDTTSIVVVFFCMTAVLAFSYPLIAFTARCTIAHLFWPGEELNTVKHVGVTLGIVGVSTTVAYFATKLTTVISLLSALCTPSLCFLLPGVWYTVARRKELEQYNKVGEDEYLQHPAYMMEKGDAEGQGGGVSTIVSERTQLLNAERYGPLADMCKEEVDFVRKERMELRENGTIGYVMSGLGVFMQIACLSSTIMALADGSS
eukprot:TRINITY_DN1941_c0_g5_i1.p1 TRINITY_DN1941_c0_g5~~TRINITY_DN1941_c0_g5_i1.p1  ORF type:complete len:567 (+),score=212.94 TRINITY_DN1941_c0_g5_i1:51-1751(+)